MKVGLFKVVVKIMLADTSSILFPVLLVLCNVADDSSCQEWHEPLPPNSRVKIRHDVKFASWMELTSNELLNIYVESLMNVLLIFSSLGITMNEATFTETPKIESPAIGDFLIDGLQRFIEFGCSNSIKVRIQFDFLMKLTVSE